MELTIIPHVIRDQNMVSLPPTASARDAARLMTEHDTAAVVVIDGEALIGIVTERDLTRRVMAEGIDPETATMADIMTRNPDTLAPHDSALDALELMAERRYRHVPVVADGRVVGMVSIRDLYAAVKERLEDDVRQAAAFAFDP